MSFDEFIVAAAAVLALFLIADALGDIGEAMTETAEAMTKLTEAARDFVDADHPEDIPE